MNGELTALVPGVCPVSLTATADGYLDRVIERMVPVDAPVNFGGIVWGDFPTTATVGVDTSALGLPEVQDAEGTALAGATIAIATTDNCAWDSDGRLLSFMEGGECVATVTASQRGYTDFSAEFRVTPTDAAFTLSWDGYTANGNAATYGADAPDLEEPSTTPELEGVTYTYSLPAVAAARWILQPEHSPLWGRTLRTPEVVK